MGLGIRFSLGPLVAYIPLTGRKRRGSRAVGAATGATVRGLAWLWVGALVVGFLVLAWPYLVVRWLGDRAGWPKGQAIAVGLAGTALWLGTALVFDALTR